MKDHLNYQQPSKINIVKDSGDTSDFPLNLWSRKQLQLSRGRMPKKISPVTQARSDPGKF